jgi:AcrR family transcriptional regulator
MVEAHRHRVRESILDAVSVLVAEHGLSGVSMARVAQKAGTRRTMLEKHFGDIDAILRAWHDRQVSNHLAFLADTGNQPGDLVQRLDAVLRAYAAIVHQTHEHHATDLAAAFHRDEHLVHARRHLQEMFRNLLAEGVKTGDIRDDVASDELASYCLHTVSAAGGLLSADAVRRLIADTLTRLQHPENLVPSSQPSPPWSNLHDIDSPPDTSP